METWTSDLGAQVLSEGVRFRVWAPKVPSVSLIIEGSKEISMSPEGKGYFTAVVRGIFSGTRYFYRLDSGQLRPDPVSRYQPEGVHGPSEVVNADEFKWEDQTWKGIPLEEMILYEIHIGAFTQEGTFEAVLSHLDYLKNDLGVSAIELMPVAQFPGERNWGYDGTCLYAPQNSYGGPNGLKGLINECHKKGLAVILDVVYNHFGPEGNYISDYGPYVANRYKTPWGPPINFDGPESDEVRKFIIGNALYWVTEYHVDGLRLDAVHGIFDFSAQHILYEISEAVHGRANKLGRSLLVIAEGDLNDVRVVQSPRKGGYGLDAQWNDDFHHSLHTLLTEERSGYYQDFGDIRQVMKALREGFVFDGRYSSFRRRRHGSSSKHLPPNQFIVFSQNHDQVGNRARGDRLTTLVSFEALKLAAAVVLLSPNIPLLFMGEEYGEEAPFQYFVSHSDPGLIEAVRKGRKEALAVFQWGEEIPDPQDEMTFLNSKIDLHLRRSGKHAILLEFYKRLIKIRKETPSLNHLTKKGMKIMTLQGKKTLFVKRQYGRDRTFAIFNFEKEPVEIKPFVEEGHWEKFLDSASKEWDGMGGDVPDEIQSEGSEIYLRLQSYHFVLYRQLNL
jgi:maltooligosyltrehalose trehalohydrolase